jgi:peptide-methionine (S)-S-oxide reductase
LAQVFWDNVDPFDDGGQFCNRGDQYKSAVFYGTEGEKMIAETKKQAIAARAGRLVATDILPLAPFYAAENYHQDFKSKNPLRYKTYRMGCGRDQRLEELKKTPSS